MNSLLRLLSFLFWAVSRCYGGEWLLAGGMAWWGLFLSDRNPAASPRWYAAAVLLLVLSLVAKAMDYTIFVPSGQRERAMWTAWPPEVTHGIATGDFQDRDAFPHALVVTRAQVRWLGDQRRPELVALTPHDYPVKKFNEYDADRSSTWCPGVDAVPGEVYMAGRAYPGVKIGFLGRRLILALENEETAAALAAALDIENHLSASRQASRNQG